jgi:hypothetical protein
VALGSHWGAYQLAINTLWGSFEVALMWLLGDFVPVLKPFGDGSRRAFLY